MISVLVSIVVIVLICGLLAWLIRSAPFVEEPFRSWGVWAIMAVAAILIILQLVGLTGVDIT
jgi:uncharacterized BrkB/YihY/UPF0761 family membrane protein